MAGFDFNTQWKTLMENSPLSDKATIDGEEVSGFFCSGTYLDKKGANFSPAMPIEKRAFVVSSAVFEVKPEKLKGKRVEVNNDTYVVLNVRGAESGVYRLELERVKA
jgi:hypothetical protein